MKGKMMRVIFLFVLIATVAWPADWTVNNPVVLQKNITRVSGRLVVNVKVRFSDDTIPTPRTEEQDYWLRGTDSSTALGRKVYDDQQTLQGAEGIPDTGTEIVPIAPTVGTPPAVDEAIQAAQDAIRKRRTLQSVFIDLLGKQPTDTIGSTAITVQQVMNSLASDIETDITNQARLDIALDKLQ